METSIQDMSSEELIELAKIRRREEAAIARRECRDELNDLRQQRREQIKAHNKAIHSIDNQIKQLRLKMSPTGTLPGDAAPSSSNISKHVLSTLEANGEMSTKQLHDILSHANLNTTNLSQTLSYLKRQGKVISPARSVYKLAEA